MAHAPDEVGDATLRLLLAPGLGPASRRRLRQRFGCDEEVLRAPMSALVEVLAGKDGTGRKLGVQPEGELRSLLAAADPDRERAEMTRVGARLLLQGDADYPPLLATIADAPDALWMRGEMLGRDGLALAMVGSRRASAYGRDQAARFAALLAQAGLTIVSGGAVGIDAESHRAALRVGGRTVAVLGCGLAAGYPIGHESLFDAIAAGGGAVLSEHPMRVEPRANHFPRRNRIISGLSLGVLVVEAAARSGALITARLAAEDHGREVMAVPGRVDVPSSAGCHRLIRDGAAALVCDHLDVIRQLDGAGMLLRGALQAAGLAEAAREPALLDAATTQAQRLIVESLAAARCPGLTIDAIAERTGLAMGSLVADLTVLEIRGRIERDAERIRLRR